MIRKVSVLMCLMTLLAGCNSQTQSPLVEDTEVVNVAKTGDANFTTTHFSGSNVCASCHNGITDVSGTDVSVENDWDSTMMANAARDPLFRAKLASEISRNPGLQSAIEQKCARCHTPMASVQAQSSGEAVALLSPGFFDSNNRLFDAAMDGVSCTLCHQMENNSALGTEAGFSGNYSINLNRIIYGPFANPMSMPMQQSVNFTPQYSGHISGSELCSSCHNLLTDVVDSVTGTLTGAKFPEQMIYSEWENSSYAQTALKKSCQDCHMPETNGVRVSNRGMMISTRDNFSKHYFVGANTFMLDIFKNNKDQLGVSANNFDKTIERTRENLQSAATVSIANTSMNNGTLNFDVNVMNNTGHKLPGGYPARRVYLHATITDSNGSIVFESGKLNSDGSIVGVDSDASADNYEAHHELVTSAEQVPVYEAIMANTQGQLTYTLMNGASYLKDNRLLPTGFDKNIVDAKIKPSIDAMLDNNFTAGQDAVSYQIPIQGTAPYTINVALNYQALAYRYAQDLFQDVNSHEYVSAFKTLYDNANIRKETIHSTSIMVP